MWSASAFFSWPSVKGSAWLLARSSMRSVAKGVVPKAVSMLRPRKHIVDSLFLIMQGLEYCEERFSQDLTGSAPPLRTQTTNTRLLSCQTIEKFRPHPDRDDSMNEGTEGSTWKNIIWETESMKLSHCLVISKEDGNKCTLNVRLGFKLAISSSDPPVASPDTSVSIFSWQVKPYGQGTPTTNIGVFDINRWYHAQMPDSLRYSRD